MKKYQFEFDKFVKDLERRAKSQKERLSEESNDLDEQETKRLKAQRYHEHPHNSVVYNRNREK
tara:strand:- start:959 stop:1147 length:189 start_codon:yes stop_codon:yes gene_type:complete